MKAYGAVAGFMVVAAGAGCLGFDGSADKESQGGQKIVAGAGYTTFDPDIGGCKNGTGVNCNIYTSKDAVYMSGGPVSTVSGLTAGSYFFAVVAPGAQLTFLTGEGLLSTDSVEARTFSIVDHQVDTLAYEASGGGHDTGTSPQGRPIIALAPYLDTPNNGGVYVLAICAAARRRHRSASTTRSASAKVTIRTRTRSSRSSGA
jgi:hypothetical protein